MTDAELSASRALGRAETALDAWLGHPHSDQYDDDETMLADIVADLLLLAASKGIPFHATAHRAESYVEEEAAALVEIPTRKRDLVRVVKPADAEYGVRCDECEDDIFCTAETRIAAIENAEFFGWLLDTDKQRVLCPACLDREKESQ